VQLSLSLCNLEFQNFNFMFGSIVSTIIVVMH
jgi:hypothetical protein